MDAIILAGAINSGPLKKISRVEYEAEIDIAGRPMLDYVVLALDSIKRFEKIVVVGSASMLSKELKHKVSFFVKNGNSLIESLINGLEVLKSNKPVLIVTSDVPLLNREALEDFLERCSQKKGDIYYSFVSKEINEQKYPEIQRTYVKLSEGFFTGGNLALVNPVTIKRNLKEFTKVTSLRKKPLHICSLLGWNCFFKLLVGKLTINEIENRINRMFSFKAVGIISPYPEVGIDVDKPSDLELAREILSK